ncbi:MAG: 4'-phosphopantetheinyl transferase superfamily protein [Thermodesulfobacteriota bacterium]
MDLRAPEAEGKSGNLRFVRRVLTETEKRFFDRSAASDIYLWAAWAAKETAYKALVKTRPDIASWPGLYETGFDCDDFRGISQCRGVVETASYSVRVMLCINDSYIHCIGSESGGVSVDELCSGVDEIAPDRRNPQGQSEAARHAAIRSIARLTEISPSDMEIKRHRGKRGFGPPLVYISKKPTGVDLSLSHHGGFAAFAFTLQGTCQAR